MLEINRQGKPGTGIRFIIFKYEDLTDTNQIEIVYGIEIYLENKEIEVPQGTILSPGIIYNLQK